MIKMRRDFFHKVDDRQMLRAYAFTLAAGYAVSRFPKAFRQIAIPILAYPLDFWQKIFAAGMHQQKNAGISPTCFPQTGKSCYQAF